MAITITGVPQLQYAPGVGLANLEKAVENKFGQVTGICKQRNALSNLAPPLCPARHSEDKLYLDVLPK